MVGVCLDKKTPLQGISCVLIFWEQNRTGVGGSMSPGNNAGKSFTFTLDLLFFMVSDVSATADTLDI
jgi:hypothetical protein